MTIEHFQPFEDVSCISYQNLGDFPFLVGGFNPFEKYISQNGNLPPIGVNIKYVSFRSFVCHFNQPKKTPTHPPLTQKGSHPANQSSPTSEALRHRSYPGERPPRRGVPGWLKQLPEFSQSYDPMAQLEIPGLMNKNPRSQCYFSLNEHKKLSSRPKICCSKRNLECSSSVSLLVFRCSHWL